MSGKTKIGWTDYSWNPVVGCTRVSAGCDHCYAFQLHDQRHEAYKAGNFPDAPKQYHKPFPEVQLIPERLTDPLRWRTPRRVFVNSVSDLFHADVPDDFIDRVWTVMLLAPDHTFQILTKRPQRMMRYVSDTGLYRRVLDAAYEFRAARSRLGDIPISDPAQHPAGNIWLGTSVENQEAVFRVAFLLKTPAAIRFLSVEPMLGPVDLSDVRMGPFERANPLTGRRTDMAGRDQGGGSRVDWVITGGESGRGHRPFDPAWAAAVRDQCQAAGVAFFHKQHGGITPKAGGRLLDGREWNEFPA